MDEIEENQSSDSPTDNSENLLNKDAELDNSLEVVREPAETEISVKNENSKDDSDSSNLEETEDSDFDSSILENEEFNQDLLDSEYALNEEADFSQEEISYEAEASLPIESLDTDDEGLTIDFNSGELKNEKDLILPEISELESGDNINSPQLILEEDNLENNSDLSAIDEDLIKNEFEDLGETSDQSPIGNPSLDFDKLDEEVTNNELNSLDQEKFNQDLLESEKILQEENSDDEIVEISPLENFEEDKSDSFEGFAGDFETVELGESEEDNSNIDLDPENEEFSEEVDDSTLLDNWEKDAVAESSSKPFLGEENAQQSGGSQDESLEKEDSLVDVNVEEAFDSAKNFKSSYEEKLEGYLVLFEITKELLKSKSFDDFFENLMYSIIGQVGPEIMIIFSSRDGNFSKMSIVAHEGIDIEPDYIIKKGDTLYSLLESEKDVIYAKNLLDKDLKERERVLLENPLTEILIPIRVMNQFSGFIVAGKMINGEEYTEKDFEFLQILVEVSGNFLSKLFDSENLSNEISELNKIIHSTSGISEFANRVYKCKTLDALYDVVAESFVKDFKVSNFSLLILDTVNLDFKVFGSNFLLPETVGKLRFDKESKIITMISQISDVYRLENFQSNSEINTYISEEELLGMKEFTVLPLINLGRMVGLFIIHKVSVDWSSGFKQTILSLSNMVSPIVANLIMQNEKESLFRNPFNPLEETIEKEIKQSEAKGKNFTLIVLKILNVTRILNILGINFFSEYSEFISKKIFENTKPTDYVSRIGQGKFAILLHGNTKNDSEIFISKIKSEIMLFHNPSRDFKLSIQIYSLTYPDQAKEKRKFIEMMEET